MEEKIILQDFTVLLVCPSVKWSTIERRVIFDSTFLRNSGCNPVILCQKGSQIDLVAESEDIPRYYINAKKINFFLGIRYFFDLKKIFNEKRFDLVHCYSLTSTWMAAFLLKSDNHVPLMYTLNHHIKSIYQNFLARWLLARIDRILTLSEETKEFAEETFPMANKKISNLGTGLELRVQRIEKKEVNVLGCVINDLNELKRLRYILKIFRVLKIKPNSLVDNLRLYIFLGPRIYQKEQAKKLMTEFDYEFYEKDILLYSLDSQQEKLKEIDILLGIAFDEPLNDFEVEAILHGVPVLFPRTAMRQNILFKYNFVGESYFEADIREARFKLMKMISQYSKYIQGLRDFHDEIVEIHGLDNYAQCFQLAYEESFKEKNI